MPYGGPMGGTVSYERGTPVGQRINASLKRDSPREFELPWREAGPPNHHDDKVDSDQWVVKKELSLSPRCAVRPESAEDELYQFGTALNLRTTTLHKCAGVPRRARI